MLVDVGVRAPARELSDLSHRAQPDEHPYDVVVSEAGVLGGPAAWPGARGGSGRQGTLTMKCLSSGLKSVDSLDMNSTASARASVAGAPPWSITSYSALITS